MTLIAMSKNGYLPDGTGHWTKCVQFPAARDNKRTDNCYSERIVRDAGGKIVRVEKANRRLTNLKTVQSL